MSQPDDAIVAEYKKSVDRTLLRENLRLTPEERLRRLQELQKFANELDRAGGRIRRQKKRSTSRSCSRRFPAAA